ncbi:MAG: hypothetical protein R2851_29480, partial [Caldilineaceae bacterium]
MNNERLSRRRFLQIAGIGAAGVAVMAACAAPAAAPGGAAEGGSAPAAEQVTLVKGHHWGADFRPRQDEFDAGFLDRHPNVTIENVYNTWADHNQIVPTWAAA